MKERDLNKTLTQADAYEQAQERIGDLAAQLHDAHQTIKRLGEELEAAEAREAELCEALLKIRDHPSCYARGSGVEKYIAIVPKEITDITQAVLSRTGRPAILSRLERMESALREIASAEVRHIQELPESHAYTMKHIARQALEGGEKE